MNILRGFIYTTAQVTNGNDASVEHGESLGENSPTPRPLARQRHPASTPTPRILEQVAELSARKEAAETELEAAAAVSSPQLVASAHSVNNRLVGVKRMMRVMSWCYTTVPTVPTEMKGDVEGGTNGAE